MYSFGKIMIIPVVSLVVSLASGVQCASLPQNNNSTADETAASLLQGKADANSTEARNSLVRKPWSPNLLGANSIASILDPLNPLATFSRLPQYTQSPVAVSSAPVYSQFDLSTELTSSTNSFPMKPIVSSPSSVSSTIDSLNEPAPGAMSLLYVCKYILFLWLLYLLFLPLLLLLLLLLLLCCYVRQNTVNLSLMLILFLLLFNHNKSLGSI